MSEPNRVLFEVVDIDDKHVSGFVRDSKRKICGSSLPRFMCPEIACIPGGSFYIKIETIDKVEEQKELDKIFRDT